MYSKLAGVYRENNLPIYKLHPVIKLVIPLSFVIAAGLISSPFYTGVLAVLLFTFGAVCGLKPLAVLKMLRPFRFLLVFTFIIQLFLTPAGGWIIPDSDSLGRGLFFTGRMGLIIGFSSFFAVITRQTDIVRIFNLAFQPLRIIRINPGDAALSMLIALRFIPLLFTEGEKILDAQRLKGLLPYRHEKQDRLKIVKSSASLVVPLFVRTFYYADQIAITLSYRMEDKKFLKLPSPAITDIMIGLAVLMIAAGVSIASKIS